jgi:hypothetical protein
MSRPSPWPWPRRAHVLTHVHIRAPAHKYAFAWEGYKPSPLSFFSTTEPNSPAFLHSKPRRRPPPRGISSAQRCECRVVHVLGRPFSCSHSHMRRPSEAVATPAAPPSRFASVRRSAVHPRARSPLVLTPVLLSTHTHPRTLRGHKPTTCARPPPGQRLQTSRRPAAVPTMISTSLCRSTLPCSFPSDPSNPVGTRKPRRGTCGLGATRPHHR